VTYLCYEGSVSFHRGNFRNGHGRYGDPAPKTPARLIHKVSHELDVPTILTLTFNDLLCFYSMCGEEKVSDLINHPVVCLFGTRVDGTRVKVVT
jgi:hypothetical protein